MIVYSVYNQMINQINECNGDFITRLMFGQEEGWSEGNRGSGGRGLLQQVDRGCGHQSRSMDQGTLIEIEARVMMSSV